MNIFEQASRQKLRFTTARGVIATEDLWDLPLLSRDSFNLNELAKAVHRAVKSTEDEDFVPSAKRPSAEAKRQELRLEILKHVIAVKVEEQDAAKARAEKAAKKEKLIELLGRKQDAALEQLTPEQIRAELDALGE